MTAAGANAHAAEPTDFTLIAGKQAGFITAATAETALRQMLPNAEMARTLYEESWNGGDGPLRCVTRIYPGSGRELWIVWKSDKHIWKDSEAQQCDDAPDFQSPDYALLALPESMTVESMDPSPWKTQSGIGLGASLAELEAANGNPVDFSTAQDTEGNVIGWHGGALGGQFGNAMLTPMQDAIAIELKSKGVGGIVSSADLPAEMKRNIRLSLFTVPLAK